MDILTIFIGLVVLAYGIGSYLRILSVANKQEYAKPLFSLVKVGEGIIAIAPVYAGAALTFLGAKGFSLLELIGQFI